MIIGHFVNFYLPFINENGELISAKDQAMAIIEEAQKRISKGSPGVAITYSANYRQTLIIRQIYYSGGWETHTYGANQAEVMYKMEYLLRTTYKELQRNLQIAPITTMTGGIPYGEKTHQEVVAIDLAYIKTLLDDNWDVLGWINKIQNPLRYAVGGGVVKNLPQEINDFIQTTLTEYSMDYPDI